MTVYETYDLVSDLGAERQTWIDDALPWNHNVANSVMYCGRTTTNYYIGLIHVKIPEQPPNATSLVYAALRLYVYGITSTVGTVALVARQLNTSYTTGSDIGPGATKPGWGANWYTSDGTHKWVGTGGAPGSPSGGIDSDYWGGSKDIGRLIGLRNVTTGESGGWVLFDLSDSIAAGDLDWGGDYYIAIMDSVESALPGNTERVAFYTDAAGSTYEPEIRIGYDYEDTNLTPAKEDKFLQIEPLSSNPEKVKLTWETPKDFDLRNDSSGSYLIVRHTSTIQDYTTGTLLVRSTENEYVDDTSGASHDGNDYHYRLLVCDGNNYISGTGTGAMSGLTIVGTPQWSNEVTMEKPDVSTFVESGADYSWNVWEEHTVNVTATAPSLSGVENTAYQYDWYGNGTETGWKTLQTPANSDSVDYAYTKYGAGTVTPKVRIKNNLGYWSSQQSLGSAITLTALDAVAVCKASPMVVDSGDVLRLRADDSDDRNGDGTITKYRFQVQRSSDLKYWDGTAGADPWQVGIHWEDEGTTPFVDVPAIAINHSSATTYTCKSEVTGLSTSAVTSSGVAVTGRTETAVTITSTLSEDTEITAYNSTGDVVITKATPIEGSPSTSIRIDEGVSQEVGRLEGVCHRAASYHTDMAQLFTWKDSQTLLRYYYEQVGDVAGSNYIDFRIDNIESRKRDVYWYEWQVEISIETKA